MTTKEKIIYESLTLFSIKGFNAISVRDIAEQHVIDDLGHIPSLEKCMAGLPMHDWAVGGQFSKKVIIDPKKMVIVD